MASDIAIGDQYLWVSNQRLRTLVEFVVEVARGLERSTEEDDYVDRLNNWIEHEYWSGLTFDLAERFPTVDEKKFWAKCFFDLGRKIFFREIGNLDADFWQAGAIGESYMTARMLCFAIREQTGDTWYPETEDRKSSQAYFDRLNIQN